MTPGTAREADVLGRLQRRFVTGSVSALPWLEPACGSGRLLRRLAARGLKAVGYDLDRDMVAYAEAAISRRGLQNRVTVQVGDMASPPSVRQQTGFAFNPWNSIRHLRDDAAVLSHLEATAAALAPGGVYAVGLSLTAPEGDPPEEDVWTATRGRCRVLQVVNWEPADHRVERAHVQTVVRRGAQEEFLSSSYDLRTYTDEQWRDLLTSSPLRSIGAVDLHGRDRGDRDLPYQFEILTHADR